MASEVRQRRGVTRIVENLDIFDKVVENVKEEKRASSGFVSLFCSIIILILVTAEVRQYLMGPRQYQYTFSVDSDFETLPLLDIDMIVATPCNSLSADTSADQGFGPFIMKSSISKDPTRFEFTDEEQMYWTVLRHAHSTLNAAGRRGLEELRFIDDDVETTLEHLADQKQQNEMENIARERKQDKKKGRSHGANLVFLVSNGGMFQLVAANSASDVDEGTACRVHGKFKVRKTTQRVAVSITNTFQELLDGVDKKAGNISHRIERFSFGPRVSGLVSPLAGAEQISESGQDVYGYYLKVVPTRIYRGIFSGYITTYQYAVTFMKQGEHKDTEDRRQHKHGGILFEFEFYPTVIEIRELTTSTITLIIRLCSIIGGVFATSRVINLIMCSVVVSVSGKPRGSVHESTDQDHGYLDKIALIDSSIRVH